MFAVTTRKPMWRPTDGIHRRGRRPDEQAEASLHVQYVRYKKERLSHRCSPCAPLTRPALQTNPFAVRTIFVELGVNGLDNIKVGVPAVSAPQPQVIKDRPAAKAKEVRRGNG